MFATRDVFALLLSLFAVFYATSLSGVVSFHPAFVVNPSGGGRRWGFRVPRRACVGTPRDAKWL